MALNSKEKKYWLLKSEPSCYSIDDFAKDKKTIWTGVRNYQARNFMLDMKKGDEFLFYHSSSEPTAVVGIGKIIGDALPDLTALDKKDDHYDPKATRVKPIWYGAQVAFVKKLRKPITLQQLKMESKLKGMVLLQIGSRLSVQLVTKEQFQFISTYPHE